MSIISDLQQIKYWVFDLDNTLYPHDCNLFEQVDKKMTQYIAEKLKLPFAEARDLQKQLFHFHGTTLHGLQQKYDIDPDEYLQYTHEIDYGVIPENKLLNQQLQALEGKKFVFTNGPYQHAISTLKQIGITDLFDGIFDIQQAGYIPKPQPHIYDMMVQKLDISDANHAIMLDDIDKNLVPASKLGMKTVLMKTDFEDDGALDSYIDHKVDNLCDFLDAVLMR
ncbi:MAG: pyrimidine 5'-nucleotidase [Alphaproteobacteria bacterium]|nr:pyrimidine 5'-nucleotidase [Alphaproteobacteria bacterium]